MVQRCWRGDDLTLSDITEIVVQRSGDLEFENFMQPLARLLMCGMWPPEAHEFNTPGLKEIYLCHYIDACKLHNFVYYVA